MVKEEKGGGSGGGGGGDDGGGGKRTQRSRRFSFLSSLAPWAELNRHPSDFSVIKRTAL